jgi:hypothetical protein
VMGIEPTYSAWKAEVLPLNYTRNFLQPANNPRHYRQEHSALRASLGR